MFRITALSILTLSLAACGSDLRDKNDPDDPGTGSSLIESVQNSDGTHTTRVNATSEEKWVFLDLDSAKEVDETDASWDLAFRRQNIVGNGTADVGTAWVEGAHPDPSAMPDESAYHVDPAGRDEASVATGAFQSDDAWYAYDPASHTLSPRERVYFVRSSGGVIFALMFLGYYDDAGTSGMPSFRWGSLTR